MKRSVVWTVACLLAVTAGASGSCLAADGGTPAGVLSVLAGSKVPTAELGNERARGSIGINVNGSGSAITAGTTNANAVIGDVAGTINLDHSIDNNTGITSVLQNFGNNAVMQVSTTINITVH